MPAKYRAKLNIHKELLEKSKATSNNRKRICPKEYLTLWPSCGTEAGHSFMNWTLPQLACGIEAGRSSMNWTLPQLVSKTVSIETTALKRT